MVEIISSILPLQSKTLQVLFSSNVADNEGISPFLSIFEGVPRNLAIVHYFIIYVIYAMENHMIPLNSISFQPLEDWFRRDKEKQHLFSCSKYTLLSLVGFNPCSANQSL